MKKTLRTIEAGAVIGILLIGMIGVFTPTTVSAKDSSLMTFSSILQIHVDSSNLNKPLQPGGPAVSVPVTVDYMVEIPPVIEKLGMLKNLIVYKSMIVPPLKIHLSILNKPNWADISIATPDVYVDIGENNFSKTSTEISIAVYKNAPAQPYTIRLQAEATQLGRVMPQSSEAQFMFTPGYIPLINIYTDKPTREVSPRTTVTFPLEITNLGNKETIVRVSDIKAPAGWPAIVAQPQIIIPRADEGNNKGKITVSVVTPYGFGWHDEIGTITLKLVALPSPPTSSMNISTTNTFTYQLQIMNRGFSIGI